MKLILACIKAYWHSLMHFHNILEGFDKNKKLMYVGCKQCDICFYSDGITHCPRCGNIRVSTCDWYGTKSWICQKCGEVWVVE